MDLQLKMLTDLHADHTISPLFNTSADVRAGGENPSCQPANNRDGHRSPLITAQTINDYPSLQLSGLSPRKHTVGPEYDIVLDYIHHRLSPSPKGQSLTVFLEPNIESVFPDIVAVYWHVDTALRWSQNRTGLNKTDIRLLHYLALVKQSDPLHLESLFTKRVSRSLERLHDAAVVDFKSGTWRIKSLRKVFAVRRLVTIEAKVNNWRQGLHQAFYNTWFASESYLLVERIPKSTELMVEAARFGIGVVAHKQSLDRSSASAKIDQIPKSYASWLFNEWAWKAHCFGKEIRYEDRSSLAAAAVS